MHDINTTSMQSANNQNNAIGQAGDIMLKRQGHYPNPLPS
jgi:hypothetical protein